MALKSKAATKIFYSMGEVCEMFDLPPSTIRFWEKNFPQIKPKKNAKGNRLFTPEDIETLKVVYHLVKEKGMTLAGANQYLKDSKLAAKKETGVVELLQKIRATLVDIRTEINSYEKRQEGEIIITHNVEDHETEVMISSQDDFEADEEIESQYKDGNSAEPQIITTGDAEEQVELEEVEEEEEFHLEYTTFDPIVPPQDDMVEEVVEVQPPKEDKSTKSRYYEPTLFDL